VFAQFTPVGRMCYRQQCMLTLNWLICYTLAVPLSLPPATFMLPGYQHDHITHPCRACPITPPDHGMRSQAACPAVPASQCCSRWMTPS